MVLRRREKRDFERALPPITDEASFLVRRRMMEEQELREMAYREKEIDDEHVRFSSHSPGSHDSDVFSNRPVALRVFRKRC